MSTEVTILVGLAVYIIGFGCLGIALIAIFVQVNDWLRDRRAARFTPGDTEWLTAQNIAPKTVGVRVVEPIERRAEQLLRSGKSLTDTNRALSDGERA
jgi:hypothetical protein